MADFEELVIAQKTEGKGRAFRAVRLDVVSADLLWDLGTKSDKRERPIYATFAASVGEIQPFVTNLLCGRPAVPTAVGHSYRRRGSDAGYEFMRSATYKVFYERHDEGVVATVYLPELLDLDPGMVDPDGIKFVVLPGATYLAKESPPASEVQEIVAYAKHLPVVQTVNTPPRDYRGHIERDWEEPLSDAVLAEMVPLAYLHALYLSNRSRAPIPPDGRFYLQMLLGFLKRGIASWSTTEYGHGSDGFGRNKQYKFTEDCASSLAPGIAFMAKHDEVEASLAEECETYYARTEGK